MKQLVLLSGIPASGKSTFVEQHGLSPYTISTDAIRLLNHSPETIITEEGKIKKNITGIEDGKIFEQIYELVDNRMARNEYIVIDAQNVTRKAQKPFVDLARKHGYRTNVVDVQGDLTLDEILERDKQRPMFKQVGEKVIRRTFHNRLRTLETGNLNTSGSNLIQAKDFEQTLMWRSSNLDKYEKVLIFGDIHGCNTVLQQALGNYSENNFYIFTGDLFDRGIENGDVFVTIQEYMNKPNVVFLQGNHENHLINFTKSTAKKRFFIAPSFYKKSLPDILSKQDVTVKDLENLVKHIQLFFAFTRNGQRYVVSHGGLVPEQLGELEKGQTEYRMMQETGVQIVNGVGGYDFDVDAYWQYYVNKTEDFDIIQFHGHRNTMNKQAMENTHSYNLEGKVEFGGHLRVAEITHEVVVKEYKNDVFDKELLVDNDSINQSFDNLNNEQIKRVLDNSSYIRKTKLNKTLTAYNFTREAFLQGKWTNFTTTARGLFLDNEGVVKARGYNKFFNLNENAETQETVVKERLVYPVTASVKENGFLGIMAVPDKSLTFLSKSGYTDYSKILHNLFFEHLEKTNTKQNLGKVIQLIKDNNVSVTFETIDCVKDKHIVKYNESKIVLLDVITNNFKFSQNDELKKEIAELLQLETPEQTIINNHEEFDRFLAKARTEKNTEGYVFRDSENYMFKLKNEEYCFVKYLRTLISFINRNRVPKEEIEKSDRYEQRTKQALLALYDNDLLNKEETDIYKVREVLENKGFI